MTEEEQMEEKKDKYFVSVKGGTPAERSLMRDRFKSFSEREAADVDLVRISGPEDEDGDLRVHIKTECGELDLTKKDLDEVGVLDEACGRVACPPPIITGGQDVVAVPTDPGVVIEGPQVVPEVPADVEKPPEPAEEDLDAHRAAATEYPPSDDELAASRGAAAPVETTLEEPPEVVIAGMGGIGKSVAESGIPEKPKKEDLEEDDVSGTEDNGES